MSGLDALSVNRGLRPNAILAVVSAFTKDIDPEALFAADVVLAKLVSLQKFQEVIRLTGEIAEKRQSIRGLGEG